MATPSGESLNALEQFATKSAPDLGRVWTAALGGLQIAVQLRKPELQGLPAMTDDRALQPLVLLRWVDAAAVADEDRRRLWQQFWQAANLLLPASNSWMIADRDCSLSHLAASPAYESKLQGSAEWVGACKLAHRSLSALMGRLSLRGFDAPTVGYELTDESGCVVAEAELAWPASRTAVVLATGLPAPFSDAGWTVALASDENIEAILEVALSEPPVDRKQ
jgi:DEAD/DEAH box helicase domain-containing protein